jgi:tRNA A37 threonylcarbamoyladenosine modification protein TsaB
MTAGLAITGSQRSVGVAAWREGGPVIAIDHVEPSRDRDWLWPSIDQACSSAGVTPAELAWVGVDIGPGGFSGLRTTIAAAQSIASVHGLPCVAVPSALVAACSTFSAGSRDLAGSACSADSTWHADGHAPEVSVVHAVLAVKGATAWIATLGRDDRGWFQQAASVLEWERWMPRPGSTLLADAHCPAALRAACEACGVSVVEPVWSGRGVMMAARRLRLEGQGVGPAELSPEYAREPEAVTLWRQRHGG